VRLTPPQRSRKTASGPASRLPGTTGPTNSLFPGFPAPTRPLRSRPGWLPGLTNQPATSTSGRWIGVFISAHHQWPSLLSCDVLGITVDGADEERQAGHRKSFDDRMSASTQRSRTGSRVEVFTAATRRRDALASSRIGRGRRSARAPVFSPPNRTGSTAGESTRRHRAGLLKPIATVEQNRGQGQVETVLGAIRTRRTCRRTRSKPRPFLCDNLSHWISRPRRSASLPRALGPARLSWSTSDRR